MAFKATHEIFSTRYWDITPDALHAYRVVIEKNVADRIAYVAPEQRTDRPFLLCSSTDFKEAIHIDNYDTLQYLIRKGAVQLKDEDQIINVVRIEGPVLRNGDACSYGSLGHRDLIRRASDDKHCIGHIIIANTPGGSAYSKYDYEEAVAYAHSKGLPVIGLVEGMACSAGYAAMALCDEIYSDGLHNIVGCIGTMMAGYMQKDGDINAITQERYVEMVADESPDKNLEYRKMAEGDYELVRKDLSRLCTEFQNTVHKCRPQVLKEQLTGKTYDSGNVVGTLIDGIGNLDLCVSRVQALSKHK